RNNELGFHSAKRRCGLKFFRNRSDTAFDMNNALLATTNKPADSDGGLNGHILTVAEVAHFLRVPKSTVYKLARLGQIPASKIGKHWRFLRSDLQHWMETRSNGQ
ncbi:MAG: helix-turn-helix domain-containing protein, partial [Nitrospirota bacterium]|nr:helix-turn-helix domain-containing protein [Nitrospirota bacterium]